MTRRRRNRGKQTPITGAQLEAWHERRRSLDQLLTTHADAEWAWLWRTRLKVIDYLIERYESAHRRRDDSVNHPPTPPAAATPAESTAPYDQAPPDTTAIERAAQIDRSAMVSRLNSLRHTNTDRRSKQPPIPPAPPPRVLKLYVRYTTHPSSHNPRPSPVRRLTYPRDLPAPARQQDLDEPEAVLEAMDERGYKALRQIIAIDLGLIELTEEVLDDQSIRAILAEHGLDHEGIG